MLVSFRCINTIAHTLGKRTIAEHVEDEDMRRSLTRLGVDYVQGYGIGGPAPIGEFMPSARH